MRAITLAAGLVATSAFAGPDSTTQYLMDDPVSVMDLGLYRVNQTLKEHSLGTADFFWDENRIRVFPPFFWSNDLETSADIEKACGDWIRDVRGVAGIADSGKPYVAHSNFAEMFTHYGYVRKSAPDSILADIDKIFVLFCIRSDKDFKYTTVSAPLLGTSYAVER